jgi:hypothetical protein
MRQAKAHVIGKRHRAGDPDQPADFGFQRRAHVSHF